jgi:malonate decarboxylase alpha subunit
MVQSVLSLPSHLDVFERGIASKLDFSFSGPQSVRLANLVAEGRIRSAPSTPTWNCSAATSST